MIPFPKLWKRWCVTAAGLLILFMGFAVPLVWGHGGEDHGEIKGAAELLEKETEEVEVFVGVDEKPGSFIRTTGTWTNEMGETVSLDDLLDRPVLLIPAYYHCPKSCNVLLADMATAIRDLDLFPDYDYRVVAISVSDDENAQHAATAQAQYFNILGRGYPESGWPFLVSDKETIDAVADSLGYRFTKKAPHSYLHPNVAIVLAPHGKIIRYIYGPGFLTADLKKGLEEAAQGTPQTSIRKVLTFCFDYDPKSRTYVFKTFRVMGSAIGAMAVLFFLYLVMAPSVKRRKRA